MPRASKALAVHKRRPNARRSKRKGPYSGKTETLVYRGPAFAPERIFLKLRWADYFSTSLAAGVYQHSFSGNSIYDPDATIGITQKSALGANSYAGLYNRYRVHASAIKCTVASGSGSANHNILVVLYPSTNKINLSNCPDGKNAMAKPSAKFRQMGLSGGGPLIPQKHFATTKRVIGVRDLGDQEDYAGPLNTGDPISLWYWNLMVDDMGTGSTDLFKLNVEIEYTVELYERADLTLLN